MVCLLCLQHPNLHCNCWINLLTYSYYIQHNTYLLMIQHIQVLGTDSNWFKQHIQHILITHQVQYHLNTMILNYWVHSQFSTTHTTYQMIWTLIWTLIQDSLSLNIDLNIQHSYWSKTKYILNSNTYCSTQYTVYALH